MTGGIVRPAPEGRRITPDGVVVVPYCFAVASQQICTSKGRGITSFVVHGYDDTRGNVTQEKWDEWVAGDEATRGWFKRHAHPDMDEAFRVTQGQVTFRYWVPVATGGFTEHEVTLEAGGYVMFAAGVYHEGWNSGPDLAVLCITGIRSGNTAPQDVGKGRNIPAPE